MPCITYESGSVAGNASAELVHAQTEVRRLTDMLKLIATQDQGAGGNVTEAEAWRQAQRLARDALRGAYVAGDTTHMDLFVCQEELRERDAMLCGVLNALYFLDGYGGATVNLDGDRTHFSSAVHDWFNETESGVTWNRMEAWWTDHKAKDEARRRAEAEALASKKEAALAKLTPEERALLGV